MQSKSLAKPGRNKRPLYTVQCLEELQLMHTAENVERAMLDKMPSANRNKLQEVLVAQTKQE